MKKLLGLIAILCNVFSLNAQSGSSDQPTVMLGYVDFREANVWLMANEEKAVLTYWETSNPSKKFTETAKGHKVNDVFVTQFKMGPLNPATTYNYQITVGNGKKKINTEVNAVNTPKLWRWRTDAPDFKIAFGSCYYANQPEHDRPGTPYGDTATDIFNRIADRKPDLMIWTGDNIYLREPDWGSITGINERYITYRKLNTTRRLLTTCPNLAIWDDHDFGPNDAVGNFYNKGLALKSFKTFWANPGYGMSGMEGTTYAFDYNDAHFLMLDNRYNRTPDICDSCSEETVLGKSQLEWLKMSLLTMPNTEFKIVCMGGQFLNSAKVHDNFSRYEVEYHDIIDFIYKHKIKNVVFITGDRHFTEFSKLAKEGMPTIYDFTVSPLTSGLTKKVTEVNNYRVDGSFYNDDRSFGMLEFTGSTKAKNRTIAFVLYDKSGKEIYRYNAILE